MNPENQVHSRHPSQNRPHAENKSFSEAAQATNSTAPDPQHPRRKLRRLSLLIVMALLLMGVGQAAFPVIDLSAVTQLIQTVRLAQDQLDRMNTMRDAVLGQVANFTGVWTDLTGAAYRLSDNASSFVTDFSLTDAASRLSSRRDADDLAWPTQSDVQNAYAGEDASVIQQVLAAHQEESNQRTTQRSAWRDSQIVIAETGQFLERVENTASTQNGETTPGLGAQLDRQIAVTSSLRDIAAHQLQLDLAEQHRIDRLEEQRSLLEAQQKRRSLLLRLEMQDALADHDADFDAAAFDQRLYTPVLPQY